MDVSPKIVPTTAPASTVFFTLRHGRPGTIAVIGVLGTGETISVQIPAKNDPDPEVDADWTPLIQYNPASGIEEAVIFGEGTRNIDNIFGNFVLRVVKSATATEVGVSWS